MKTGYDVLPESEWLRSREKLTAHAGERVGKGNPCPLLVGGMHTGAAPVEISGEFSKIEK